MKKLLCLVVSSVMAISLAACGGTQSSTDTSSNTSTDTTSESKPEYVFKYAELNSDDNINAQVAYKFAEYVDELSDGRIAIDVYTSGTLGDEVTCLNALQMGGGTVDIYRGNTSSLSDYGFKKLNLFGLPYIFTSRDNMWKVLENEDLGQSFLDEGSEIGAGMVGLAYTDEGARNIFTTKEISSLEDIKGMKIRVPETTLMMDTMTALGAQPTPISYSELYSSLQTGVVDGAENGLPGYESNKFYEVAPYYLLDGHTYSPGIMLMAEEQWDKLSEEDQNILREAGEMASEWNREQIVIEEQELMDELESQNVKIIECTEEEKAAAQKACESVWDNYDDGVEDLLQEIVEIQQ